MKLKKVTIRLILAILALLAGSSLKGETVLVTQINGIPCDALHILTVYQQGSDVIVTKYVEERHVVCANVVTRLEATLLGLRPHLK